MKMLGRLKCAACDSKDLAIGLVRRAEHKFLRTLKKKPKNLSVTCNACGVNVKASVSIKQEEDEHLLQLDDLYKEVHLE